MVEKVWDMRIEIKRKEDVKERMKMVIEYIKAEQEKEKKEKEEEKKKKQKEKEKERNNKNKYKKKKKGWTMIKRFTSIFQKFRFVRFGGIYFEKVIG